MVEYRVSLKQILVHSSSSPLLDGHMVHTDKHVVLVVGVVPERRYNVQL